MSLAPARPGYRFTLFINQGHRNAVVLAVLGQLRLVEYTMPRGTTALAVVDENGSRVKGYSYKDVPLQWLRAVVDAGMDWEGRPQQAGHREVMSVDEALKAREQS